jgi:hypothetical protein
VSFKVQTTSLNDGRFAGFNTTGTSSLQIQSIGDLNNDGYPDVVVADHTIGSNELYYFLNNGDGTLGDAQTLSGVTTRPVKQVLVDFNNDGNLDVVSINYNNNTGDTIGLYYGNGNGTFSTGASYTLSAGVVWGCAGDFNHNGYLDLAIVSRSATELHILLNDGSGGFANAGDPGTSIIALSNSPIRVVCEDINGDGKQDLIVARNVNDNTITIFNGNGDGTFAATTNITAGSGVTNPIVTDLNGDGKPDLAIPSGTGTQIRLYYGQGAAPPYTLDGGTIYSNIANTRNVNFVDFTGNGIKDMVAITASAPYTLSVWGGNGNGTFGSRTDYSWGTTGSLPLYLDVADMDLDGKEDIVTGVQAQKSIVVLPNTANGILLPARQWNSLSNSHYGCVAVGDFDNDGFPDVARTTWGNNKIRVHWNQSGKADFTSGTDFTGGINCLQQGLQTADLDGDGFLDLVVPNRTANTLGVLLNQGLAARDTTDFAAQVTYATGLHPRHVTVVDLDGDGYYDLITANLTSDTISIFLGNGDGTFQGKLDYSAGTNPLWVKAGDFNNDGILDLIVTNNISHNVSLLLGNGDGTFQPQITFGTNNNPNGVAIADVNADGDLDLIVGSNNSNSVQVFLGNGAGNFPTVYTYAASGAIELIVADMNNNGFLDIIVGSIDSGVINFLQSNGDGTFQAAQGIPAGGNARYIRGHDFNGNGATDFVYTLQNIAINPLHYIPAF